MIVQDMIKTMFIRIAWKSLVSDPTSNFKILGHCVRYYSCYSLCPIGTTISIACKPLPIRRNKQENCNSGRHPNNLWSTSKIRIIAYRYWTDGWMCFVVYDRPLFIAWSVAREKMNLHSPPHNEPSFAYGSWLLIESEFQLIPFWFAVLPQ